MPRLPIVAVLCGATLIGVSLGGVASTGRELAAVSPQVAHRVAFDSDRDRDCHRYDHDPEL